MRRPRPRLAARVPALRVALVAALIPLVLAGGCSGPSSVSLADLAAEQWEYDGEAVTARGVVVEFGRDDDIPHHFVIQDSEMNRVQLLPNEAAEPHVGSAVQVEGRFEMDPDRGRVLHVETIEPAGS